MSPETNPGGYNLIHWAIIATINDTQVSNVTSIKHGTLRQAVQVNHTLERLKYFDWPINRFMGPPPMIETPSETNYEQDLNYLYFPTQNDCDYKPAVFIIQSSVKPTVGSWYTSWFHNRMLCTRIPQKALFIMQFPDFAGVVGIKSSWPQPCFVGGVLRLLVKIWKQPKLSTGVSVNKATL